MTDILQETNVVPPADDEAPPPSFGAVLHQYTYEDTPTMSGRRTTRSTAARSGDSPFTPIPSPLRRKSSARALSSSKSGTASPATSSLKRKGTAPGASPSASKKKRSSSGYAPPSKYAHLTNLLTDSLAPNLICVFIGLNPGIRTATTGHAYSHPSNLFWKFCYSSGCHPRLCKPSECHDLPQLYAVGNTNIVARATKDASELSKEEMDEGVDVLEEKARRWRPESVCIVGKSIWESIWRVRHGKKIGKNEFKYGWQDEGENMGVVDGGDGEEGWRGAKLFVATTTSGLAAGMKRHEKEEVWKELGEWVAERRRERGIPDEGGVPDAVEQAVQEAVVEE